MRSMPLERRAHSLEPPKSRAKHEAVGGSNIATAVLPPASDAWQMRSFQSLSITYNHLQQYYSIHVGDVGAFSAFFSSFKLSLKLTVKASEPRRFSGTDFEPPMPGKFTISLHRGSVRSTRRRAGTENITSELDTYGRKPEGILLVYFTTSSLMSLRIERPPVV